MKTFETEKHNIPEGATHYRDETVTKYFAWIKGVGSDNFNVKTTGSDVWIHCAESDYANSMKLIPQTKEVEWVNGDKCRRKDSFGDIHNGFVYLCPNPFDGRAMICKSDGEEMDVISVEYGELLEPETEAERVEREKLEAAYDLYCEWGQGKHCKSFDEFKDADGASAMWLRVVRKTGYRKESE